MSAPKIPEGADWDIVRDAFRGFNLNPNDPEHWVFLLKAYIGQSRRRGGRHREWSDEKLVSLAADFSRVQHDHPDKSDRDICRILARRGNYGNASPETLRRKLQDARDPEHNLLLAQLIDMFAAEYEVEGGNTRQQLRAWLTTGFVHIWQDETGELHSTPPEPPPPELPRNWPGHAAIRLVKK